MSSLQINPEGNQSQGHIEARGKRVRILSLDGGGVRGISSLYILKELMAQVRRQQQQGNPDSSSEIPKPCEVFDLICGTSTGGLIALMLGRLEMEYKTFAEKIFTSKSKDRAYKFSQEVLGEQIKGVITRSPLHPDKNAPLRSPRTCQTFVITTSLRAANSAVRLRSYNNFTADASEAKIYEAALATSAAPTFFRPIEIDSTLYGDGGMGWNNPSEEAIAETRQIVGSAWAGAYLISIGTGLEEIIRMQNENDAKGLARSIFGIVAPGRSLQLDLAEYCVQATTSCEKVHRKIDQTPEQYIGAGKYFRLNVPQSMGKIGLEEWKKINDIIALTKDYMQSGSVVRDKVTIARILLDPYLEWNDSKYNTVFDIPHQVNTRFCGREAVMLQIDRFLKRQKMEHFNIACSVGLHGYGGIGKTQVAIAYCFMKKEEPDYSAIFWASAVSRNTFIDAYQAVSKHLFGNILSLDREITANAVKEELQKGLKFRSWLLVVDNADKGCYEAIKDLIPYNGKRGTIIVTTRSAVIARTHCRDSLPLDPFSEEAGAQFLLNSTKWDKSNSEDAAAVARDLGCFPLALEQAAAYVRETDSNFKEYLRDFRCRKENFLLRGLKEYPEAIAYYRATVFTTLSVCVASVTSENSSAEKLLKLLAFFSPADIPEKLLQDGAKGVSDKELQIVLEDPSEARNILIAYSLIRRLKEAQSIWIHVLLQDVIRVGLNEEERTWALIMTEVVSAAFPRDGENITNWPACRRYLSQALRCLDYVEKYGVQTEAVARLLSAAGFYLKEIGEHKKAGSLTECALHIREKLLGGEHLDTAQSMNDLGLIYWQLDRLDEAENLFTKVRSIREKYLGPRHGLTGWTVNCLAIVALARNDWNRTRELLQLTLSILSEALGPDHPKVGSATHDMGQLALNQYEHVLKRKYLETAEKYFTKALQIREKALGRRHPETARSLYCLGYVHHYRGHPDLAITELLEAKEVFEACSPLHFETAFICRRLRDIYKSMQRFGEAIKYGIVDVKMTEGTSGLLDLNTIEGYMELVEVGYAGNNLKTCEEYCRRLISSINDENFDNTNERFGDLDRPKLCWLRFAHNFLGLALMDTKPTEAEAAFKASLHYETIGSPIRDQTQWLTICTNLLSLYLRSNNLVEFNELGATACHNCMLTGFPEDDINKFLNVIKAGITQSRDAGSAEKLQGDLEKLYEWLKRKQTVYSVSILHDVKNVKQLLIKKKRNKLLKGFVDRIFKG